MCITTGSLIDFTVSGKIVGSVIHVEKGEEVNIKAISFGHKMVGSPSKISIISMGNEINSIKSNNTNQDSLILQYSIKVDKSKWFLVHVDGHNGSFALSSPIYVIVDNKRAVDGDNVENLINDRLCKTDILKAGIRDIPEYQRKEFLKRVDNAEIFWKAMPDTPPDIKTIKY